jgi:hypothetical protein
MMDLQSLKHCLCEQDHGVGVLLVDVESETIPHKDKHGKRLYYCLKKHHIFSAEMSKSQIAEEAPREVSGVV